MPANAVQVQVIFYWFSQVPGSYKYKYNHADTKRVDIESIITTVVLEFNLETNMYSLDPEDAHPLNEFVETS
jgi:hypothetical protein